MQKTVRNQIFRRASKKRNLNVDFLSADGIIKTEIGKTALGDLNHAKHKPLYRNV